MTDYSPNQLLQRQEPRPKGVRIAALDPPDRERLAHFRYEYLIDLLRASGCAVTPDPKSNSINFHTGQNLIVAQVDVVDPRRIQLLMMLNDAKGDLTRAFQACAYINETQFASKASVIPYSDGFALTLSVGIYAEEFTAFTNSLKAYTDDLVLLYHRFIDEMIRS